MRTIRALAVFAASAFVFALVLDPTPVAADPKADAKAKAKELRKLLKKQLEEEAKKPAEPKKADVAKKGDATQTPPKPAAKPVVVPKDNAALTKFIDDQIDAKLRADKVSPSMLSSDEEFVRRVYLDLTGVIPTAQQAVAFLDSKDPYKRSVLIDELLASPNFGRHQADVWQAKLYLRESDNRFLTAGPLVKWLEGEFNKNTPWDKLVTSLVTATGTVEANPATLYTLSNRSVDKLTDSVGQHFMGIQLMCAQCHNHPFTAWKQTEYWGMAAFFSKTVADKPKNTNKGGDNTQIGVHEGAGKSKVKDFFPESTKTVPAKFFGGDEPKIADKDPARPVLAAWLTSKDNPYFAKAMVNRTWAQLFGLGFVNPVDDMHEANPASHPDLLAGLSKAFGDGGFDLKNLYRVICNSQTYQRSSKPLDGNDADPHRFARMTVKVLTPEQLFDSLAAVNGNPAGDRGKGDKGGAGPKGQDNSTRGRFVAFFLAGADEASTTEYEAGIPQALKLMNSRQAVNPAAVKALAGSATKPADVLEKLYLSTLARRPTKDEVVRLSGYVGKAANPQDAYGDILWAILNSSEFTMCR